MTTEDDPDDSKVTQFPNKKKRREILLLRGANDREPVREPILNMPPVVKWLSFFIIVVFLLEQGLPWAVGEERADALIYTLGFVPARYVGDLPLGIGGIVSPVTHLFLHGGWLHIAVNLLSLIAFGAGIEKWLGGKKFLLLFFASGIAGALCHFAVSPHLASPMIGASGAISGLFGALLILMKDKGYGQGGKLWPFILLWVGTTVFFGWSGVPGTDALIAWVAHLGGFAAGLALARPVARMKI
jgi:membrane associated rhomboid family serine protease